MLPRAHCPQHSSLPSYAAADASPVSASRSGHMVGTKQLAARPKATARWLLSSYTCNPTRRFGHTKKLPLRKTDDGGEFFFYIVLYSCQSFLGK